MDETTRSGLSRRMMLAGLGAVPLVAAGAGPSAAQTVTRTEAEVQARAALKNAKGTKLAILGTGAGPVAMVPSRHRLMTSHVMLSNGAAYVLDFGLGVTNQFARTGINFRAVRSLFITQHHTDHNIEYGPFLVIGWISGLPLTVKAYGPPPLKHMTAGFLDAWRATVDFWAEDFKVPPLHSLDVTEISAAGPVMEDENVKVSAIIVNHPPVKPALAYRFDFHDRSIAFSGDTTPLDAVAKMAEGADLLVHEAMDLPAEAAGVKDRLGNGLSASYDVVMAHMRADHSPVEDVGRIAQEAGVKTLVLSHLVPSDGVKDDVWRAGAAKAFKGKIIVAHDLMVL
jgi:ribonuclease BN (tRNA processing enzyme)